MDLLTRTPLLVVLDERSRESLKQFARRVSQPRGTALGKFARKVSKPTGRLDPTSAEGWKEFGSTARNPEATPAQKQRALRRKEKAALRMSPDERIEKLARPAIYAKQARDNYSRTSRAMQASIARSQRERQKQKQGDDQYKDLQIDDVNYVEQALVEFVAALAVGPSPHVRPDLIGRTIAGGKKVKGATTTADVGLRSSPTGFAVGAHKALSHKRKKKKK